MQTYLPSASSIFKHGPAIHFTVNKGLCGAMEYLEQRFSGVCCDPFGVQPPFQGAPKTIGKYWYLYYNA